jgi:exopolyphosphatase/guanosine-5'-triphosphate,3'-diphosphate pyrophosphatase
MTTTELQKPVSAKVLASLERVGVIDIGSNSVRLVVFDGAARSPAYFYNEKILCGLGKGFRSTGRLNPEGYVRALNALRRFARLGKLMNLNSLTAIATAAVRDAEDGSKFCAEVDEQTGITIQIASGKQEARLSAQGILLGWPGATGLVCDIGGSSMELAELNENGIGQLATSPLGPLQLEGLIGGDRTDEEVIEAELIKLTRGFRNPHDRLFLVGGSWRAIAKLDMEYRSYPLHVLNEYCVGPDHLQQTLDWIDGLTLPEMIDLTGSSETRMSLIPLASKVLKQVLARIAPKEIYFSSYGLREGLLYERMPDEVRQLDPVMEACRFSEESSARFPGFGDNLADWLLQLFSDKADHRLIRAACLLHDVSWRAHPDYRADLSFENATRANLGGLDHRGRLILSLALHYRYKSRAPSGLSQTMYSLLPEEDWKMAELLGRAIRFGALLPGQDMKPLGELSLSENALKLHLNETDRDLFGEVVEKRMDAVAKMIGVPAEVSYGVA